MSAYVISEVAILDEAAAANYRRLAAASIAAYGGRYLVRGADPEVAEGSQTARQFVVVEFPSLTQAHDWYASPAYAEALRFRERALKRRLVFLEGIPAAAS